MRSWVSLLRTARAPLGVLVLCAIGLIVPRQTRDMMTALTDDGFVIAIRFHLALLILGILAWYWSRAALSARWGIDDDPAERGRISQCNQIPLAGLEWVPRLLFGGAGLIGLILLRLSDAPWVDWIAILGWIAVGLVILHYRTHLRPKTRLPGPQSPLALRGWLCGGIGQRFCALLERAPGGKRLSGTLAILSILPFLAAAVAVWLPHSEGGAGLAAQIVTLFPGPGIAVFGFGLMIGPLTILVFVFDGLQMRPIPLKRFPILALIGLWVFVVVPEFVHSHTLRIATGGPAVDRRPTLKEYFGAWSKDCFGDAEPIRPIIVAVSGGATKAGMWAARVLYDVEAASGKGRPVVFAVSSVSGGSLGVAAYMALQSSQSRFCTTGPDPNRADTLGLGSLKPDNTLYHDALGPALAGWLLGDIPRALIGWPFLMTQTDARGGDSAEAIERAFEALWTGVTKNPKTPDLAKVTGFDQPFLSLFYDGKTTVDGDDKHYRPRPGMPLWIANGTDVTTGNRILTVPIRPDDTGNDPAKRADGWAEWPFSAAKDLLGLLRSDVPISTAINNTARFPVLEPFGDVLPLNPRETQAEVIDGGYFEDEGIRTALDLAHWLEWEGSQAAGGKRVDPIIVQVTADADEKVVVGTAQAPGDIVRCPPVDLKGPTTPSGLTHMSLQVLGPILGMYNVRGGQSAAFLRDAAHEFCDGPSQRFFHFYLSGQTKPAIPMNWMLSDGTARLIWGDTDPNNDAAKAIGNAAELDRMQKALAK